MKIGWIMAGLLAFWVAAVALSSYFAGQREQQNERRCADAGGVYLRGMFGGECVVLRDR